ncbi:hypothetical protein M422DRAFT_32519 [Sphaerobolus stellatus SS14]|uniref:Uncharacterized protein n=1 Tax=Sphaerobolus stellatus (strain SS14) TaxID=990650 RepID=A0A0C9VEZ3_SPHS4|nr:hypothetical protein M422DRAFT_32519 [Sphaerobolus stellatus SS14]
MREVGEIVDVLRRYPNLKDCQLTYIGFEEDKDEETEPTGIITLSKLARFKLHWENGTKDIGRLLESLRMPRLEALDVALKTISVDAIPQVTIGLFSISTSAPPVSP